MKNNGNFKKELLLFGNLKVMVACAFLVAISIVCGKLIAINVGTVLRFSFENMPILLSSIAFGPLIGGVTAVVADIIGCLIVGYEINPLVTLGAFAIGVLSGLIYRLLGKMPSLWKTVLSVIISHIVGSVIIKTFGLAKFYEIPLGLLFAWRGFNYAVIGILEIFILYYLLNSRAVAAQLERIKESR
ncbi:MAG: folate family ECF transporter S component [Clostridia bacterium]|nr:folate family ECF transporter S component [Clostridia bacterium]